MPNEKNLVPFDQRTEREQREIAQLGGIASGRARRRKRAMREAADYYLSLPETDRRRVNAMLRDQIKPEDIDNQMAFDFELQPDDRIEVYRSTTDRLAVKLIRAGVESNLFGALDEDSDLLELAAGDNLLKLDAQTGVEHLQAAVSFYPMDTGLLPEVMPCTSMF